MADFVAEPNAAQATCNTCRARFDGTEALREHYRGDWHILNAKRRTSDMPPVSREEFRRHNPGKSKKQKNKEANTRGRVAAVAPSSSSIKRTGAVPNRPAKTGDATTDAEEEAAAAIRASVAVRRAAAPVRVRTADEEEALVAMALKMGISKERSDLIARLAIEEEEADLLAQAEKSYLVGVREKGGKVEVDGATREAEAEAEEEEEEEEEDTAVYLPVAPTLSLFDNKEFATSELCVEHMEKTYGFFIPDRKYLTDMDGLLNYLGEKVKIGGICLYCQRRLKPGWPCMEHMRAKSHCKIRYEEGVDADEFEDFFDFNSSYAEGELDEDGEPVGGDKTMRILPGTGELQLHDGTILGHRQFRHVYNAYVKPEDTRPAVLMEKRESLIRLEGRLGGLNMDAFEIGRLSDNQVVAMMVRERKHERKMLVMAERDQRRFMFREQRKEYKSVKDKIRSSEVTTAKIRDYHSILM